MNETPVPERPGDEVRDLLGGIRLATIGATFVPVPTAGIDTAFLDDEAVLYDGATDQLHLLNRSAMVVWILVDGHADVASIVAELAETFEHDEADITPLVVDTLYRLAELGVIEPPRGGAFGTLSPVIEEPVTGARGAGVNYLPVPPDP